MTDCIFPLIAYTQSYHQKLCKETLPYQSIPVDPLAFMHPQVHKLLGCLELVWLSDEQSLKHVTEVPDVELVVKVCCGLPKICCNLIGRGQHLCDENTTPWM